MSKLLFDESPLVVQPTLAKAIGLNEAIILQQILYWMNQKGVGKTIRGERWIYNTIAEWQTNFPFWSQETIKRAIYNLEEAQLVKTGNYNQSSMDRTKWYTVNFATVELLEALIDQEKELAAAAAAAAVNDATGQNDTMDVSNCYDIPESTSKTTKANNKPPKAELAKPTANPIPKANPVETKPPAPNNNSFEQMKPLEAKCWRELANALITFNPLTPEQFCEIWHDHPDERRHNFALDQMKRFADAPSFGYYKTVFLRYDPDKPKLPPAPMCEKPRAASPYKILTD